jgi:hypothetical protein
VTTPASPQSSGFYAWYEQNHILFIAAAVGLFAMSFVLILMGYGSLTGFPIGAGVGLLVTDMVLFRKTNAGADPQE